MENDVKAFDLVASGIFEYLRWQAVAGKRQPRLEKPRMVSFAWMGLCDDRMLLKCLARPSCFLIDRFLPMRHLA